MVGTSFNSYTQSSRDERGMPSGNLSGLSGGRHDSSSYVGGRERYEHGGGGVSEGGGGGGRGGGDGSPISHVGYGRDDRRDAYSGVTSAGGGGGGGGEKRDYFELSQHLRRRISDDRGGGGGAGGIVHEREGERGGATRREYPLKGGGERPTTFPLVTEERESGNSTLGRGGRGGGAGVPSTKVLVKEGATVIVTNVPNNLTASEIQEAFSTLGEVLRTDIMLTSHGEHTGRVSVQFTCRDSAEQAVCRFDGGDLNGNTIRVFLE